MRGEDETENPLSLFQSPVMSLGVLKILNNDDPEFILNNKQHVYDGRHGVNVPVKARYPDSFNARCCFHPGMGS